MQKRITLIPDEGMRVTNGDKIYSKYLTLPVGHDGEGYYEITEAEYEKILAEQEQELDAPEA